VVAVAAAASFLHHDLAHGHLSGLAGYAMVFFAIWWAWVNYSWFASAYDTGDVIFRLLTFVVMTGVLVLAAGTPAQPGRSRTSG
jgi:low temperature requirement protein LtrA